MVAERYSALGNFGFLGELWKFRGPGFEACLLILCWVFARLWKP